MKEPIDPEIVLFGLILVSFLPLNSFSTNKPSYVRQTLQLKQNIIKYILRLEYSDSISKN